MMPKRKKKTLIIGIITAILVIIAVVLAYLYFTTDLFKSNSTLFGKYMLNAVENIETLGNDPTGDSQKKLFQNNKYITQGKLSARYVSKMGTTDENTTNVINNLEIGINGKTDDSNQIDYRDLTLLKNNESLWEIELLKIGNKNGLRFTDLFNQYIMADNDEKSVQIGDTTTNVLQSDFSDIIKLSNEDIDKINSTYVDVFVGDYKKENYSKAKDQMVTVNNKTIKANEYSLTMTKEQMNDTYIKLLETMKSDQVLLGKIDNLQNSIYPDGQQTQSNENQNNETKSIKDRFIEYIDQQIENIKSKNIGNEQIKVSVYEINGQTVKIKLVSDEYECSLDMLNKSYFEFDLTIKDEVENSFSIIINKADNEISLDVLRLEDKNEKVLNINQTRQIDGNTENKITTLEYKVNDNKATFKYDETKEIVNNFDETPEFTNKNSVNMSTLSEEQSSKIQKTVEEKLNEKLYNIQTQINYNELFDMLKGLELINEEIKINELPNLTNAEINSFNSKFEFYKGENLPSGQIVSLIEEAKEHLETAEVVSSNQIKLNIVRNTPNHELATKIEEIVNNDSNKGKEYTVSFEYDQETGILTAIIINIQK